MVWDEKVPKKRLGIFYVLEYLSRSISVAVVIYLVVLNGNELPKSWSGRFWVLGLPLRKTVVLEIDSYRFPVK